MCIFLAHSLWCMHPTLDTATSDSLPLCSTCSPKHLIFWVLHCPHCKLLLGVTSPKFPLLSLRSLLHPFFNDRSNRCHSCICSCFLFLPASSNSEMFCLPYPVRASEPAGREQMDLQGWQLLLQPHACVAEGLSSFLAQQFICRKQSKWGGQSAAALLSIPGVSPFSFHEGTCWRLWWIHLWMVY